MASKIGKLPVAIPGGVTVKVDGDVISVKGPKGELKQKFNNLVKIDVKGSELVVNPSDGSKNASAAHGCTRGSFPTW